MKSMVINWVFFLFSWTLHRTYRYRFFNLQHRRAAEQGEARRPVAIGLWHQNSFIGTLAHTYQPFSPLCSLSSDGRMVAFLCRRMGLKPILGSSSRGGKPAREALLDGVSSGLSPAITVDGPRGPPYRTKNGIIDIAKKAQILVLPVAAVADRSWRLRSWDKLQIPKPFSRVAICYGAPIYVPPDAEEGRFEACRAAMDASLNALESETRAQLVLWTQAEGSLSRREVLASIRFPVIGPQ